MKRLIYWIEYRYTAWRFNREARKLHKSALKLRAAMGIDEDFLSTMTRQEIRKRILGDASQTAGAKDL